MCEAKKYAKIPNNRIDKCLKILIQNLKDSLREDLEILASCCGHGKYPLTIIVKNINSGEIYDMCSNTKIPRTRNFYKRDKSGYYYIPEVQQQC